jgi:DNA helicase-2/ATP-dependent DNA helicase PcrA
MADIATFVPLTLPAPVAPASDASAPVSIEHAAALLRGLNREQRRAVAHGDGPQLVLAGPGTGKTEVITRRVAWLIATKRARPHEILALTFTDKAASEMQARVDVLVPYGQADAAIHTFHAFGDRLVREHAYELGLPADVRLLTRSQAVVLLRDNLFDLGLERYRPLGDPGRFLGALVDLFGRAKDEGVDAAAYRAYAEALAASAAKAPDGERDALLDLATAQAELARAYERYQALLGRHGCVDHGDQVALAVRLLRDRPSVGHAVRQRFSYVLVDEFQDTNPTQLELVFQLTGTSRNVTVVGDDDQAIYAFRGAATSNMRRFAAAHRDLRRVVLRRNYRSRSAIVAASQRLIGHNDPNRMTAIDGLSKQLVAHRRGRTQAPVRSHAYRTAEDEADGIAEEIAERISGGAKPSDIAVLVRTNAEIDPIVRTLRVRGVPHASSAPPDLYARPEVRALLCYLRVIADPQDSIELYMLATAHPYELGGDDLTALLHAARRRHRPLWDVLLEAVDQPGVVRIKAASRRRIVRLVSDVRAGIELSHARTTAEVLYEHLRRTGRLARLAQPGEHENDLLDVVRFFELVRGNGRLVADDRVAVLVPYLDTLVAAGDQPADSGPDIGDAVAVLTVHRAKGLEFPVVFLTGLVDGRFPRRGRQTSLALPVALCAAREGAGEEDPLAEERRLFYVAMTRARDELILTCSTQPRGRRAQSRPSPFIAEALDLGVEPPPDVVAGESTLALLGPPPPLPVAAPRTAPADAPLSLSYSAVEEYVGCPERYRLRHVVGVPTPTHHALTYGSALHQAVAAFHLRQRTGEAMSEEELLSVFATHWSADGFLSRQHEEARFAAGQQVLRLFRAGQLATMSDPPAAIERSFSFRVGRDEIRGRIDRLDDTGDGAVITDYKSSDVRDQRKADQKARESLQLQVYALAHQAETGRLPHRTQLHFLESGVVGRATPDPARLERATKTIGEAADGIRAGSFPARPNPVACGYCPYRQICSSSAA